MSKELEACFKEIYREIEYVYASKVNSKANENWHNDIKHYDNIRGNVLTIQRYLEAIDNAKPSKALNELEKVIEEITISNADLRNTLKTSVLIATIKQALIKSQEQEKVLEVIWEKPFASASTINYIRINKDNPNMLNYEHYCMTIDVKYRVNEEEFDLLKRC